MKPIIDISPPVSPASIVFPGDPPCRQQWIARIGGDSPVNTSLLSLSPHTGAHADAPLHFDAAGLAIGEVPLDAYLGRCRVLHTIEPGRLVEPRHVAGSLADLPPRVLIRTRRASHPDAWDPDFPALSPSTMELLIEAGARLIGIDTPSVDPAEDADLSCHRLCGRHGIALLENLLLDRVEPGDYELIALPLRLTCAEASPVRAVLRPWPPA